MRSHGGGRTLQNEDFQVLHGVLHSAPRFRDGWRGVRQGTFLLRTPEDVLVPVVVEGERAALLESSRLAALTNVVITGFLQTEEANGICTSDFFAWTVRVLQQPPEVPLAAPSPASAEGGDTPRTRIPPEGDAEKAAALIAALSAVRRDEVLTVPDVFDRAWRAALKAAHPEPGADDSLYRAVVGARAVLRVHHSTR